MTCSDCIHCKAKFETRIQPAYFSNGGMCPPIAKTLVQIRCNNELKTGVFFLQRYKSVHDFIASDENGPHTTPCELFEDDD